MAMSETLADSVLNANLTTGTRYMWLHTGDPGSTGSQNVALFSSESTDLIHREPVTFGSPTNDTGFTSGEGRKVLLSSTGVEWTSTEIEEGEVIKYFSFWTSSGTGGTAMFISATTSKQTSADGVTIAAEDIEVAIEIFKKSV